MNPVELKRLLDPSLSHLSRSLYTFFLRPAAVRGPYSVNLDAVTNYLCSDSAFFPTPADRRSAQLCLCELELCGLIRRENAAENWEGAKLKFPCFETELSEMPARPFAMTKDWQPGPGFMEACLLCGLEDNNFTPGDLAGFTGYWAAKPEKRTQTAWERTFAQRLCRRRSARSARPHAQALQTRINYSLAAVPDARARGFGTAATPNPATAGSRSLRRNQAAARSQKEEDDDVGVPPRDDWDGF